MQIGNPLRMNDWDIRKFLITILSIQLVLWGAIGLDFANILHVPILRQLTAFIYLIFVPGTLLLRILKMHKLDIIETLLYEVGLSIFILMFAGFFMNLVYPFFGISNPISINPLIITFSALILMLCVLCYILDKDFNNSNFIYLKDITSQSALFLFMVPFLAVFGTFCVNFYHNNIILELLIIVCMIISLLITLDKFIPKNLYSLAIFVISISVLFHTTLISMYLVGTDCNRELFFANLVIKNSVWDTTILDNCNAMLSVVMLAPIYSIISDMSITWVFKIMYIFIFSLVPLCLYRVFQRQTNDKIAFLSSFFFLSVNVFYVEMASLARQQIAELFFALIILLIINEDLAKMKRAILFAAFGASMAVSHYGLSYIYMLYAISTWLLLVLAERPEMQKMIKGFNMEFGIKKKKLVINPSFFEINARIFTLTSVMLFVIFSLSWYMHISGSSAFGSIILIGDHIADSISTDFLKPESSQGLRLMTAASSPGLLHSINKFMLYTNQIFIIIGGISLLFNNMKIKFEAQFALLSLLSLGLCFAGVSIPFFSNALNMTRLYHITLFFLSPLCLIGGIAIFKILNKVIIASWTDQALKYSLKMLSIYFAVFFICQTGLVSQLVEGKSGSISLGQDTIRTYGDIYSKNIFYSTFFMQQDILGVTWISINRDVNSKIYADFSHKYFSFIGYGMMPKEHMLTNVTHPESGSYIYLGYPNIYLGVMNGPDDNVKYWNISGSFFDKKNMIYSNGGSKVYN